MTSGTRSRILAAVLCTAVTACVGGGGSIRLASIHQIESSEIIAGEEFKIFGEGFIPGPVEIVLDGVWLVPGSEPKRQSVSWSGHAVTEQEISTVLPLQVFRKIGGPHALFEGEVKARFAASERVKPDWIEGVRSRVVLDVLSNEPDGGSALSDVETRTGRFLETVGVEGRSDADGGFVVTRVEEDGSAERSGLEVGDTVVVARGMRVYSELDLLPAPAEETTTWVISRRAGDDRGSLREVDIAIPRAVASTRTDPLWFVAGAACVCLVMLQGEMISLLLLPLVTLRRLGRSVSRRLRRKSRVIVSEGSARQGTAASTRDRWYYSAVTLPAVLAAASTMTAVAFTIADRVHVAVLYILLAALAWLSGFRSSRTPDGQTLVRRLRRLLSCLLAPGPLAVLFIWRGLYTLQPSLEAAASGQGLEPWTWHGLKDPFAMIMVLVVLHSAVLGERRDIRLARHVAHQVFTVVTCSVLAYVALGGIGLSTSIADPSSPTAAGLGLVLYLAKVLALYLLVQAGARERISRPASDLSVILARPAIVIAALVGSVMLGPDMLAALPTLPHLTVAVGGAALVLMASAGRREPGSSAVRIRPW